MRIRCLPVPLVVCATCFAQGPLQASLTALTPIVVSGVAGAPVSHPAGPLTSASLVGPAGTSNANFAVSLVDGGTFCTLFATSTVLTSYPNLAQTSADLLLQVTPTAPGAIAYAQIQLQHGGDSPDFRGFEIDVGNDGTVEVDTGFAYPGSYGRRDYALDFAGGPFVVRIRHLNAPTTSVQGYSIDLRVDSCPPSPVPTAPACAANVIAPFNGVLLDSNYQLGAFATAAPNLLELRTIGYGDFDTFLVSDVPVAQPLQLPAPYAQTCDVLANVLLAAPGVATAFGGLPAHPQPVAWTLVVPQLPVGLTLYVQHLSASFGAPFSFGASNRMRLDT